MTITITQKHCKGTLFDSITNDALKKAIQQQHPEIKVEKVFDGYLIDAKGNQYPFDNSDQSGYSRKSFSQLVNGEKKSIMLDLGFG